MNSVEKELDKLLNEQKKLNQRIDDLKEQKRIIDQSAPENKLAIMLHDCMCTWDHTNGCGWYYEISKNEHNWASPAHQDYLKKARNIIMKCEEVGLKYDLVETVANIILDKKNR